MTGGPMTCVAPQPLENGSPVVGNDRVDPRWLDVTVGHLLSHRSGLPRGGNSGYRKIGRVRDRAPSAKLDNEESLSLPAARKGHASRRRG